MFQEIVIPSRRVPVLLGKQGKTRQRIETATKAAIKVERSGVVSIQGEAEPVLCAATIVKAIGRGFNPSKAMQLLDESKHLSVITLEGETEKTRKRLLSRVIGKQGRARKNIEKLTGASIVIQGKTISIIGDEQAVSQAASAVEGLLSGRKHGYVYSRLEKK